MTAPVLPSTFSNLQPCLLGGICVPLKSVQTKLGQELAEHKILYRDGSSFEPMGRNSITFDLSVPFSDTIDPAPSETWKKGTLFSKVLPQVIKLFQLKQPIDFQHPWLGTFKVFIRDVSEQTESQTRSGVDVSISLVEHVEGSDSLASNLETSSLPSLEAEFSALDAALSALPPVLYPDPLKAPTKTLGECVRQLQGIADQAEFLSNKGNIMFNRAKSACDSVVDSAKRLNNVLLSNPITRTLRIRNGLVRLQNKLLTDSAKPVRIYRTTQPNETFQSLSLRLSNSVSDLIRLNPNLLSLPTVSEDRAVKYYGKP